MQPPPPASFLIFFSFATGKIILKVNVCFLNPNHEIGFHRWQVLTLEPMMQEVPFTIQLASLGIHQHSWLQVCFSIGAYWGLTPFRHFGLVVSGTRIHDSSLQMMKLSHEIIEVSLRVQNRILAHQVSYLSLLGPLQIERGIGGGLVGWVIASDIRVVKFGSHELCWTFYFLFAPNNSMFRRVNRWDTAQVEK